MDRHGVDVVRAAADSLLVAGLHRAEATDEVSEAKHRLPRSPRPPPAIQKTSASLSRLLTGSLRVARVATTKKRRPVEEVAVKTILRAPIQTPITSLGTVADGDLSRTTRPG